MRKHPFFLFPLILFWFTIQVGCENDNLKNEIPKIEEEQSLPDNSVKIIETQNIEDKYLDLGEAHNLPLQIIISLENGDKDTVPIEWNGYFNPVHEAQYQMHGSLYTKHKAYIIPIPPITVNVTVKDQKTKIRRNIFNYDQETCLMGASNIYNTNNGKLIPITAINRQKTIVQETILDEYEFFVRVLESGKEHKEYQDSILIMNNYNWQQMATIMFNYFNEIIDSSYYDILPPIKDAELLYDVRVVYRYAKQEVTSPIELTEAAQELLKKDPEEFRKKYGSKYISSITLGYNAASTIPYNFKPNSTQAGLYRDIEQLIKIKDDKNNNMWYINTLETNTFYHTKYFHLAELNLADKKSEFIDKMKSYIEGKPELKYDEMYLEYSDFKFN